MHLHRFLSAVISSAILIGCSAGDPGDFTKEEKRIISRSSEVMYVPVIWNEEDSLLLRTKCIDFSEKALESDEMKVLCRKMFSTVQSPEQDGVGLAATQVGLVHRIFVLQRLDKEGEPFEAYANAHIEEYLGEVSWGSEGCLSVPPYRGDVPRYEGVIVSYRDPFTLEHKRDTVTGYTAIIFQHENDHLDGTIYRDKARDVTVDDDWKEERREFSDKGLYDRPDWMKYPKNPKL